MIEVSSVVCNLACAHRLMNHKGKCAHIHGHNFYVTFSISAPSDLFLEKDTNILYDFHHLKKRGLWIEQQYDHRILLNKHDEAWIKSMNALCPGDVVLFDGDPTSEALAIKILTSLYGELSAPFIYLAMSRKAESMQKMADQVLCTVTVEETKGCEARASKYLGAWLREEEGHNVQD